MPFARFSQLLEVTQRHRIEERKFLFQQSVFISWWIYTSIPKGEDARNYTMEEWLDMYGLLEEPGGKIDNEDKLKEEINKAYRNYSKITQNIPTRSAGV